MALLGTLAMPLAVQFDVKTGEDFERLHWLLPPTCALRC